jgi:hypothetical protein
MFRNAVVDTECMTGRHADAAPSSSQEPAELTWAQTWALVRAELGQRLLSLVDLDDPERPAAFVLRERAAHWAALLIVELERIPADGNWWVTRRRSALGRRADRAMRRCRPETYPEMLELVTTTAHNLRLLYREIDAGLESPWPTNSGS